MGKKPLEFTPPEGRIDFENLSVEYRMKLIAYQDEIFRAKKQLQESDLRMSALQNKLDNYLRNKENQLAEIMFTAHTNAQRIEVQARSQVQYYLDEMELELQRKQREIEIIEEKTSQFDKALVTPSEPLVEVEKPSHLTVVEGSVEKEPIRKIEKMDIKPEESLPTAKKKVKVSAKKAKPSQLAESREKVAPPAKLPRAQAEESQAPQLEPELPAAAETIPDITVEPAAVVDAAEIPVAAVEQMAAPANADVMETESPAAVEIEPLAGEEFKPEIIAGEDSAKTPSAEAAEEEDTGETIEDTVAEDTITEETITMEEIEPEPELLIETEPELHTEPEQELHTGPEPEPVPAAVAAPPAAKQAEINERMQLDAFIDVRYFNDITGSKELYHHALQITIEVDVPADNYSVRYTKVSSDVVSTLMKYDNVILNDIYPFNFIAPNPNSIATYFFNLLDDMLQMMDLRLHKMSMSEFPDMNIVVEQRNTAFDNMLHKGDDMFKDIRNSLPACVETEPRESSALKDTLSKLLKKRV